MNLEYFNDLTIHGGISATFKRNCSLYSMILNEICSEKAVFQKNGNNFSEVELSTGNYQMLIADSIQAIAATWDKVAPPHDLFLSSSYLSTLERNPPEGMTFGYLVFKKAKQPIGIAYCQIEYFRASESLNIDKGNSWKDRLLYSIKKGLSKMVSFYTLACGNVLVTGEHGYYFDDHAISSDNATHLLQEGLELMARYQRKERQKSMAVILIKDFFEEKAEVVRKITTKGYTEFAIQPTMLFSLNKEWKSFEDYLSDLTSKYRVRVRRAFKKAKSLEKVDFSAELIESCLPVIEDLYKKVADASEFNVVQLDVDYLLELKKDLGEKFKLTGYFDQGELIAFYTTILNGSILEAHYLGLDNSYNRSHQLYLNILLEMVEEAIEKSVEHLHFARTALEIKSSVGAEAFPLQCFVRHRNPWLNRLVPLFLGVLNPDPEWVPRNPFKKNS